MPEEKRDLSEQDMTALGKALVERLLEENDAPQWQMHRHLRPEDGSVAALFLPDVFEFFAISPPLGYRLAKGIGMEVEAVWMDAEADEVDTEDV